jgi:hypothetical protein
LREFTETVPKAKEAQEKYLGKIIKIGISKFGSTFPSVS